MDTIQLRDVIGNIPEAILNRPCLPHSLEKIAWQQVSADQPAALANLTRDYMRLMQDRLKQLYQVVDL